MKNRYRARAAQALQRPLAKVILTLGAIFLAELTLMLAAERLQLDLSGWRGALADATIVTAVALAIMWPLIVKPIEMALAAEHAQAQVILDAASDAIITIDDHGIIQAQNRAAQIMFGVSAQDAIGRNISVIVPSPHREHHDQYLENYRRTGVKHMIGTARRVDATRMNGEVFPIELSINEVRIAGKRRFTAIIRDITERKRLEDKIQKMAHYDELTGLAGRALFRDRLSQAIELARRRRGKLGLLYLDLDRFKPVNDNYGHAAGDALLCAVAARLRESVRAADTVARLGGDEFAVILAEINSWADAGTLAEKLRLAIDKPYALDDVIVWIGASIGIAIFPDEAASGEGLLKIADEGMYRAKQAQRAISSGGDLSPTGH